ncbi:hypothetical protein Spla01_02421 [Streptomyces platensis]|uniref:Uncharacterized protein n=1 Tax=Streptomyces platensis TaxID=58346 RepID=A0ABX3XS86_STRPT|nr:hypothetical protein BG653_05032 [Streptomyces platensis]
MVAVNAKNRPGATPGCGRVAKTGRGRETIVALTFAIVVINAGNRLAAGLRAPVTSLDLPQNIPGVSRS